MKEIQDIVKAFGNAQKQGRQTALATVVHVEGSSYRRPGARMLVTDEGRLTGAISGGCLEGDALRKALSVIAQQKSRLVTYDTMDEDDAKLGAGLGCNGIIHILFEPVDASNPNNPISLLTKITAQRQQAVLVTLFSMSDKSAIQPGTCLLKLEDGTLDTNIDSHPLFDALQKEAEAVLDNKNAVIRKYELPENNFTAFVELIQPMVSLVVVGAGNDVIPLVQIADVLGWQVSIVHGRRDYATSSRFPSVQHLIVSKPGNILSQIAIDTRTVFVLMTHNYNYDLAVLKELLLHRVTYIGILGPKKKFEKLLAELKEEDIYKGTDTSNIYAPVGLDIGAEAPEEIALSIIAEIKAVLAGKKGKFLREGEGTIHSRSTNEITQ
jgi:xanthine dehydrogenase accessory factor